MITTGQIHDKYEKYKVVKNRSITFNNLYKIHVNLMTQEKPNIKWYLTCCQMVAVYIHIRILDQFSTHLP